MSRPSSVAALVALLLIGLSLAAAGTSRAAAPTIGQPWAIVPLGGPTIFRTTISADQRPARVEVLVRQPGDRTMTVLAADVRDDDGDWMAEATLEGHIVPHTRISFRFRTYDAAGSAITGPEAETLVADARFEWRTVSGPVVRVHWYTGDDAFARRALDIAEGAVANAATLLGVGEQEPMDLFLYNTEADLRGALGPGTRENVGGEAHADIRTMYARLSPGQIEDPVWRSVIAHELTHLVFNAATDNDYRPAAFWLNEGVAVYLSEGNSERWQSSLRRAVADNSVIPLQGMTRTFGAGDARFGLGYAEAVSAVDFFVKTYGEPKLWELVRSYAEGLSDDDAFERATGADLASFNLAWMQSIGARLPIEHGPQPGLAGPLPPDWHGLPPATPGPVVTPGAPRPTARPVPGAPGAPDRDFAPPGALVLGVWLAAILIVLSAVWLARRRSRRRRPATWYWPPPPQGPSWPPGPPGPPDS